MEHKNILSGSTSFFGMHAWLKERFHHGRGLFLLLAVATDAESSKLGKLTSEILNDLQLIVRTYKYLNICNPPLKMNG